MTLTCPRNAPETATNGPNHANDDCSLWLRPLNGQHGNSPVGIKNMFHMSLADLDLSLWDAEPHSSPKMRLWLDGQPPMSHTSQRRQGALNGLELHSVSMFGLHAVSIFGMMEAIM
jgi:hypothetical protein